MFVSKITSGVSRRFEAVKNCRDVRRDEEGPEMEQTRRHTPFKTDGVLADIAAATSVPLKKAYK